MSRTTSIHINKTMRIITMQNSITAAFHIRTLNHVALAALGLALLVPGCRTNAPEMSKSTPALKALPQFTAANVPVVGPEEIPIDQSSW